LKTTSHILHPSFTFNGLQFESVEELLHFSKELAFEGDDYEVSIGKFIQKWLDDTDTVLVKTSGSTGKPKKIPLLKTQMINSAKATGAFFDVEEGTSALLCVPVKFIAGKMMLVRALVLGWNLHIVAPQKNVLTQYDNDYDFVAMVPYQVHHSINALKKVKKLIIGGGVVSKELKKKLQSVPTQVYATYGMTETITHIAVKRINGENSTDIFTAIPGVKFSIDKRECLVIEAPHISEETIITNDLVTLVSSTEFQWLGRIDNIINSGGIKIYPEKVEEALSSYIKLPFIIASEKDEELGERVILIIENEKGVEPSNYSEAFATLSSYERPKRIYTLSNFPYTKTEKIKRKDVLQVIHKYK